MSSIPYKLKRTITGGFAVSYQCPKCREGLRSSMKEVGTKIQCPNGSCQSVFVVPGIEEREKLALAQSKANEKKEEKKGIQVPPKAAPFIETKKSEPEFVPQLSDLNQPWQGPKVSAKSSPPGPIERDVSKHQWVASSFRVLAYVIIAMFSFLPILGYLISMLMAGGLVASGVEGSNLGAGIVAIYSTVLLVFTLLIVFIVALPYFWLSSVLHVLCKIAIAAERNNC